MIHCYRIGSKCFSNIFMNLKARGFFILFGERSQFENILSYLLLCSIIISICLFFYKTFLNMFFYNIYILLPKDIKKLFILFIFTFFKIRSIRFLRFILLFNISKKSKTNDLKFLLLFLNLA